MNNKPLLAACAAALGLLAANGAQAALVRYASALAPEAAGATGSGFVTVDHDTVENTLLINATWSGLSGTTTVAHIHCCTAIAGAGTVGVAVTPGTLPFFPAGLGAGSYTSPLIDLDLATSFTAGFVTTFAGGDLAKADDALLSGILAGRAYFNVHSTTFPGGEIRGFLQVPEPGTLALMGLALGVAGWTSRRRAA